MGEPSCKMMLNLSQRVRPTLRSKARALSNIATPEIKEQLAATGINTSRTIPTIFYNLTVPELYEASASFRSAQPRAVDALPAKITDMGALAAYSGLRTGRVPQEKRIVFNEASKDIWWGPVNIPLEEQSYEINRNRAIDYLNTRPRLYVVDGFAGWDPKYRIKVRVVACRAYHALFMTDLWRRLRLRFCQCLTWRCQLSAMAFLVNLWSHTRPGQTGTRMTPHLTS